MRTLAFYMVLITIFDLAAVYFGKMYSLSDKWFFILFCSMAWAISGVFFSLSLKYEGMAVVNILWIAVSTIAATTLGVLYFKENLTSLQYVAMGIIVVGIILLFYKPSLA
jgi:multidrug transporter EmrE-like cation transporter